MTDFPCCEPKADMVIPPEAVEAVARQVFLAKFGVHWDNPWFDEARRAKAQQDASEFALIGLQAALPHLQGPLVTGMTPSPEATAAGAKALNEAVCICRTGRNQYGGWYSPQPTCPRCGDNDTKAGVALTAALPHLRPLVEAQELRLATEVALKLGRQEMREEIAQAFDREVELIESLPDDEGVRPQVRDVLRARRAAFRDCAQIARGTGKGDS